MSPDDASSKNTPLSAADDPLDAIDRVRNGASIRGIDGPSIEPQ